MNRLQSYLVVVTLCCFTSIAYGLPVVDRPFTPQRNASEISSELKQFIPSAMQEAQIPGLSIAIMRDGEIIYTQAFGLDNYWDERPLATNQIFEVASLSKPVMAYGVLKLVDKGLLDLDEPITGYLPNAPAEVTLYQALTHTSALQHVGSDGYAAGGTPGNDFSYSPAGYLLAGDVIEHVTKQSLEEYLLNEVLTPLDMMQSGYGDYPKDKTRMAQPHASTSIPLLFVGTIAIVMSVLLLLTTWAGRWLIGKIRKVKFEKSSRWWKICIAAGIAVGFAFLFYMMPKHALLYSGITMLFLVPILFSIWAFTRKPPMMKTVGVLVLVVTAFIAWQRHPIPVKHRPATPASYAGLRATASDMALFLDELMNPKHLDNVLVQEMLKPQVEVNSHNAWGLGIGVQTNSKQKNIWHWGINYPGYQALMIAYPEHRLGIIILMNGGVMLRRDGNWSGRGIELAREVVAEAIGGEHHDYWLGIQ